MATAQVFSCNYSGSIKNKLLKGGDKLFLKIEDTKISGKAFICNEEGRNGYIDNFEYPINDVREVYKGDYQGDVALIMNTRVTSLYGTKKAQTIFPSMKDIDIVIEKIGQMKESHGGANAVKEVIGDEMDAVLNTCSLCKPRCKEHQAGSYTECCC